MRLKLKVGDTVEVIDSCGMYIYKGKFLGTARNLLLSSDHLYVFHIDKSTLPYSRNGELFTAAYPSTYYSYVLGELKITFRAKYYGNSIQNMRPSQEDEWVFEDDDCQREFGVRP